MAGAKEVERGSGRLERRIGLINLHLKPTKNYIHAEPERIEGGNGEVWGNGMEKGRGQRST